MAMNVANDFIETYEGALDVAICATLIRRFDASGDAARGETGSGVDIKLKDSWDIRISGRPVWADAERALNAAMMTGLMNYLRKYPYLLLAPIALRMPSESGDVVLDAQRMRSLSDEMLQALIRKTLRPGSINLQKYVSDQGGYP
jgi:hypothetical protein